MSKLLVHRGESLVREIDLTGQTVRIGRNPDCELFLEDASKSVSRNHAEIRYENGRYVLVDRESQNGVWVSGSRLPSVVLGPNVVASVGPYRLMLEPAESSATAATEYTGLARETVAAADDGQSSKAPPVKPPPQIASKAQKRRSTSWFGEQPKWLLGTMGAVVVGALALGVWLVVGSPAQSPPPIPNPLDGLEARINKGDCAGALIELDGILASNPADLQALEMKRRAQEGCQPVPPPPETDAVPDIGERLKTAAAMLENGDCPGALTEHIEPVLAIDPTNLEAAEMKKKAETCGQPPVQKPGPTVVKVITPLPPEQGGLPLVEGENEKNYLARVAAMKERYAEAESALSAMDYPKAIALFEGIVRDTSPKYLNASSLLADARSRLKESAQKSMQAARDFESKGDLDRAIDSYRRARQADSSLNVDADIKRLTGVKVTEGRKLCEQANAHYSYARNAEAQQLYLEVLRLLPSDDPCVAEAIKRVPNLRR